MNPATLNLPEPPVTVANASNRTDAHTRTATHGPAAPGSAWITWLRFAAALLLASVPGADGAETTPLATLEYRVVGTHLRASPAALSVPKGVPGSLRVDLVRGDGSQEPADSPLLVDAHVEAVLRGPSFPARRLVALPGSPLSLPVLNLVGEYQIDGIRLVESSTGTTRMEADPASVPVRVFDEVLVSRVTSRPLSMQEITDKGIVVDANSFRAVEFEVGFVLDGVTIPVKFPVIAPDFRQSTEIIPEAEVQKRLVTAQQVNDQLARQLLDSGDLPPELQRPGLNLQIKGVNFERVEPNQQNLGLPIPPIPALLLIPGNIGYLNQFFSVQIFTENAAPSGSGLTVHNVQAKLLLPPGPDGIRSTNIALPGDDPLRFARVGPTAETHEVLPLIGPTPSRLERFGPGQGGSAEFLVEGLQEGLHVMDLDLTADLDGLAAGTVRIKGKAAGSVLVRNPKFSLTFSHPRAVRTGEPYDAHVTILNTSSVEANLVSVSLRSASLSGGVLESPEVVPLGNIAPGQSATATYRVRAQRTGSVRFSNLTTGENSTQGRFNLTMAVDERGVDLSTDSIGYPDFVQDLPSGVVAAANRVLGQALGVATAPILPPGVLQVSRATVTRRVLELAEAGQRSRYGDAPERVLLDLYLDWHGGRAADAGFEQILRDTDAGREFRAALFDAWEAADTGGAATRLIARADDAAGRGEAWWFAASDTGSLAAGAVGAAGAGIADGDRSRIPGVAGFTGARGSLVVSRGSEPPRFVFRSDGSGGGRLVVIRVNADGSGTRWTWDAPSLPASGCHVFEHGVTGDTLMRDEGCDGVADGALAAVLGVVAQRPVEVLTILQDTEVSLARPYYRCTPGAANNYGNVVAVLFSKPMTQTNANIPSAYRLDSGSTAAGVQVQPGGRVALLSLVEPISAIRPRTLAIQGIRDGGGLPVDTAPRPIQTTFRDGVAISGRVLRADGSVAAGVPVTVTYYDPWKDPFDRCDPVIITRIAQKTTDADGGFSFDFVHGGVGFTVAATDTGGLTQEAILAILASQVGDRFAAEKLAALAAATNALASLGVSTLEEASHFIEGLDRAVWHDSISFSSGRMGGELTIGLRFRGRATVAGRVLAPDGVTPVQSAAVNLFPDPASRELVRGVFTDAEGGFVFRGVPLGTFSVQVKSPLGHFRSVAGVATEIRTTNHVDIVLTAPDVREVTRTGLAGRVIEPGTQAPHDGAAVFLTHAEFGTIAAVETDAGGDWAAADIPTGRYFVRAFSRDNKRKAESAADAVTGSVAFVDLVLQGVGVVVGRVETSNGTRVANALVAGGESLVRTDAAGEFRTVGVPLGLRTISAGLEGHLAPGGFPRLGSVTVDVLPGVDNVAVIRLRPAGMIAGTVFDANGVPVPDVKVAIPVEGGFAWVEADGLGRYQFPNMSPGDYLVSAPSPPTTEDPEEILNDALGRSEEEALAAVQRAANSVRTIVARRYGEAGIVSGGNFGFTRTTVRADGDIVEANIQYLPTGEVAGHVLNDQGIPIGARVRLTGLGLNEKGEPATVKVGDRDSDPATGEFRIGGLAQGPWALQVANPFYPVVIHTNSITTRDALDVTNVVMQFPPRRETNGRLVGIVTTPEGEPAGAGVRVKINFSDDYEIRTDAEGRFDTQFMVPARLYTVEAIDPDTGLRGQVRVQVLAGLTNSVTVPLLGKSALRVVVLQADGSPAEGALVRVDQNGYPDEDSNGVTDALGVFELSNLFAGRYSVSVQYRTGSAVLEARSSLDLAAGQPAVSTLVLGPTGTVRGVYRRLADGAPVSFARVNVGGVVYPTTDASGRFEVTGLKPGTYRISARDPVSGSLATASATLSVDGQVVEVSLVELPQGVLSGTVFQLGQTTPVAGAEVTLRAENGITPVRSVTTGPDGRFEFPGTTPGGHLLLAQRTYGPGENYQQTARVDFPVTGADTVADLVLPARRAHGRVLVRVLEPGTDAPASSARVNGLATDPAGEVVFDGLNPGSYTFRAVSTVPNETSSAASGTVLLTQTSTNLTLDLTLSGVGRVRGIVLDHAGASPVAGAEIRLSMKKSTFGIPFSATALAGGDGRFEIGNVPHGEFEVRAIQGALIARAEGTISAAGQVEERELRLGPSGSVIGRLVRADGATIVPGQGVLLTFEAPSGLDGANSGVTDSQGRFSFGNVPVGPVTFSSAVPAFDGLALKTGLVAGDDATLDLGDVVLDEAWPEVIAVEPAPGTNGVDVATVVRIVFSEPMRTNSLFVSGIQLRQEGSATNLPATLQWAQVQDDAAREVILVPARPLLSLRQHRVTVVNGDVDEGPASQARGPRDRVGRPLLAPFVSRFTTRDAEPPVLVSVSPAADAVQVDPRTVLRFAFSEPIRGDLARVTVSGPGGMVAGTVGPGTDPRVLLFTPAAELPINARYTATLDDVVDLSGNPLVDQPRSLSFDTLDTLGPELATLGFAGGRSPVGGATLTLEATLATPESGVVVRFTADGRPLGSDDQAPYGVPVTLPGSGTVVFRAVATDRFGNEGPILERTVTLAANEAPVLTLLRGAPGNAPVPTGGSFAFTVGAIDDVGVTNLLVTVTGPTNVVREFSDGQSRNLQFQVPTNALAGGRIVVRARASDGLGAVSLERLIGWDVSDGTPPVVALVGPTNQTVLDLQQPLRLDLALHDNATNLHVRVVTTGGLASTNLFEVAIPPNTTVTNTVEVPLAGANRRGGSLGVAVTVIDGGNNSRNLTATYRLPDIEAPYLVSIDPPDRAERRGLWDQRRDFTFSEDLTDASRGFFTATNNRGEPTPVTVARIGKVVRVTHPSPLLPGTTYTNLLLPGIVDDQGNALVTPDGDPLPDGTNAVFTTAAILGFQPTNGTPVRGGETISLSLDYEAGLGARYFRFALNGGTPVEVQRALGSTQATAQIRLPLRQPDLVLTVQASDNDQFNRPHTLPPVTLNWLGDAFTNQPPAIELVRISPPSGPVTVGSTFSFQVAATDDFGVTNLAVSVSGPVSTNLVRTNGTRFTMAIAVPPETQAGEIVTILVQAADTLGETTTATLDIPVLGLEYPFPPGTVFHSRGPVTGGTVWAIDPTGGSEVQLTTGLLPRISPDGRYLAFRRGTLADPIRHDLFVRDLATGQENRVIPEAGLGIVGYDWTADSARIVFDIGSVMETVDRNGSNRVRFLPTTGGDDAPVVHPWDGRVAFHNHHGNPLGGLHLASPDGATRERIPGSSSGDFHPVWSPDGEWLAFLRDGAVWKTRPDGYDRQVLASASAGAFRHMPVWSADGRHILASATRGGTNGIWSIPADGGAVSLFRSNPGVDDAYVGSVLVAPAVGAPPELVQIQPTAGATGVSLWTTNVVAAFNRALDPATVGDSSVVWSPGTAPRTHSGSRVILSPSLPLNPGTTYRVAWDGSIADRRGQTLGARTTEFTTAAITAVAPASGTPVRGGTWIEARVAFEPGLGAKHFRVALEPGAVADVAVPDGATEVRVPVLVPLDAGNAVLRIQAGVDAAFTTPWVLPNITLPFQGNSGTNTPPVVQLVRVGGSPDRVPAGASLTLRAQATSDFGITNLAFRVTGAFTATRSFPNAGPAAATFDIPADLPAGSELEVIAEATDRLGIRAASAPIRLTVETAVPLPAPGTILYSRAPGDDALGGTVWAVNLDGTGDRMITHGVHPRLAPDGRNLLVGRDKSDAFRKNIHKVDLATGRESLLFAHADFVVFYDWTRDSSQVVFDYQCAVRAMNADGSDGRVLLSGDCWDDAPAVNPVDGTIAFYNDRTGNGLWLVNADGSGRALIPNTEPGDAWPQWSPDGTRLAFRRGPDVLLIRPDGTDLAALTSLAADVLGQGPAVWTPDGTEVVVVATVEGVRGLYRIPVDGTGALTRIPTSDGDAIRFVGSVARAVVTPSTPPRLVQVSPAAAAVRQPLWPAATEYLFTRDIDPASVTSQRVAMLDATGTALPVEIRTEGPRVRLVAHAPLVPGATYTNLLLPGLTGIGGAPVQGTSGALIPASGLRSGFTTARVLGVLPAPLTPVVAGQSVSVRVNLEAGLGARWLRAGLQGQTARTVPVPPASDRVEVVLPIPADATTARILLALADEPGFANPLELTPVDLAVTPLGTEIAIEVPAPATLIRGQRTGLQVSAVSSAAPLTGFGLPGGYLPPRFVSTGGLVISNTASRGTASMTLNIDATFAAPGTYQVPVVATNSAGATAAAIVALEILEDPAFSVTRWKDPVDGNWNDASRWTAGVPGPALPAVIEASGTYTVTLTTDVQIGHLTLGGGEGQVTLRQNGRALRVDGLGLVHSNALLRASGTFAGTAAWDIDGRVEWEGGTWSGSGPVRIRPNGVLSIPTSSDKVLVRSLVNFGRVDWSSGRLFLSSGGEQGVVLNEPSGEFVIGGNLRLFNGRLVNLGLVRKLGTTGTPASTTAALGAVFENRGRLALEQGDLELSGTLTHHGRIEVAAGSSLALASASHRAEPASRIEGTGTVTIPVSAGFETRGDWDFTGTLRVAGTVRFQGSNPATLSDVLLTGNLEGSGDVTVTNRFEWTAGDLRGDGVLHLATGTTASIGTGTDKGWYRTLRNATELRWLGGRIFAESGALHGRLEILPGATFDCASDDSWFNGSIENDGLLRKSGDPRNPRTSRTTMSADVLNRGRIEVRAGGLLFSGGTGTHSGIIEPAAQAAVLFSGGNHRFAHGSEVRGSGEFIVSGGSIEVAGAWSLLGRTTVEAGTLRFQSPGGLDITSLTFNAGNLGGAAELRITEAFRWESGTIEAGGRLEIGAAALAVWQGPDRTLQRRVVNLGRLEWSQGNVYGNAGLYNLPGGTVDLRGDVLWHDGLLLNDGLLRKSAGTGTASMTASFQNRGEVLVESGTFSINGASTQHGVFHITPNAALAFASSQHAIAPGTVVAGGGRLVVRSPAQIRFDAGSVVDATLAVEGGTARFQPGSQVLWHARRLQVGGTLVLDTGAPVPVTRLDLDGALGGSDTVRVTGDFVWSSGRMDGAGVLEVSEDARLHLTGSDRTLDRALILNGTGLWDRGSTYNTAAGRFRIQPAGELEITGDFLSSAGRIENHGRIRRTAGDGLVDIRSFMENTGRIDLETGTLALSAGGSHTGTVVIGTGTGLIRAGNHTFAAGSQLTGAGFVRQTSGTTQFAGTHAVEGLHEVAGTLDFTAGATVALAQRTVQVTGTLRFNTGDTVGIGTLRLDGVLGGTDTVVVGDLLEWTSGTMRDTGTTHVAASGRLELSGTDRSLWRALRLEGPGTWSRGTMFCDSNGLLRVENGARLELASDLNFNSGVFENLGIVERVAGDGNFRFGSEWRNRGRFEVRTGTVVLAGASTNSAALRIATNAVLQVQGSRLTLEPGTTLEGEGTLRLTGASRLVLAADVAFGPLQAVFTDSSAVLGNFTLSNGPGGLFLFDHTTTVPGSLTVGGTLHVAGAGTILTIERSLRVLASGAVVNDGTLRVGAFQLDDGATYSGAPPVVLGLPAGGSLARAPVIREIRRTPLPAAAAAAAAGLAPGSALLEIVWESTPASEARFHIETTTDLIHWRRVATQIERLTDGTFRTGIPVPASPVCIVRVVAE
jgi:Tol biopolymer transport system component/protocatechuate 3,4-dioxygenase beta subunit